MILQNEYQTWRQKDRHARAYRSLSSATGRSIARQLGIKAAEQDANCLACHSDNISPELRGDGFSIADGIGCEVCHGGAKGWVGTHSRGWATRDENVRNGMYPLHRAEPRARLCLTCHQGTPDQSVNHTMIAAGHPRLVFELDTYTLSQPAHFKHDADYRSRKPGTSNFDLWRAGQLQAARSRLKELSRHIREFTSSAPEFTLFECTVCHQSMDGVRASHNAFSAYPKPQTSAIFMVLALAEALAPAQADSMSKSIRKLQEAGGRTRSELASASEQALLAVDAVADATNGKSANSQSMQVLLTSLLKMGAGGKFQDYTAAEQAITALAMAGSFTAIGKGNDWQRQLDQLYASIASENAFSAIALKRQFAEILELAGE